MGASLQAGGNGGGRRRRHGGRPMAEINVTPMVDVMLVLLIIFMVTAPLLTVGVPIDLPKTQANQMKQSDDKPLEISISGDGKIYLQETEVPLDEIVTKLKAISGANSEARVYVRGDSSTNYGLISKVLGAINGAGFTKVGLVQLPEQGSAKQQ